MFATAIFAVVIGKSYLTSTRMILMNLDHKLCRTLIGCGSSSLTTIVPWSMLRWATPTLLPLLSCSMGNVEDITPSIHMEAQYGHSDRGWVGLTTPDGLHSDYLPRKTS